MIFTATRRPTWADWPTLAAAPPEIRQQTGLAVLPGVPRLTSYVPFIPTPKQAAFLCLPHREALFGGAAGPGKSTALLMSALQFVDIPGYRALLLRRTYADLKLPGALIDMADDWLSGTDARWESATYTWHFPSGATLTFGYLDTLKHLRRYQGASFHFVGFDELTQFPERYYRYLFSRARKLVGSDVPLRIRSASNPGDEGHVWVNQRFRLEQQAGRIFIPSLMSENPHLDVDSYLAMLNELDPVTRAQLANGDWDIMPEGNLFKRTWFQIVNAYPQDCRKVRYWDLAATEDGGDWTVGLLMGEQDGAFYVLDVQRIQGSPAEVEALVKLTASMDGIGTEVVIEREPGSSGKSLMAHYARTVLRGYSFRDVPQTTDKLTRAKPLSSAVEHGNVRILHAAWNRAYLDEICAFPAAGHDDQVDATSGAHRELVESSGFGAV